MQAIELKSEEDRQREDRERAAVMEDTSVGETAMREATVPWPRTEKQLVEYIRSLKNRPHDYGTCVYAMSMAAVAAFQYIAGQLSVTGVQSGCADMDVIRRTQGIKGPFIILSADDALYPQYDLRHRLGKAMEEWRPWLKDEATKNLAEVKKTKTPAHPDVIAHWKKLASK